MYTKVISVITEQNLKNPLLIETHTITDCYSFKFKMLQKPKALHCTGHEIVGVLVKHKVISKFISVKLFQKQSIG